MHMSMAGALLGTLVLLPVLSQKSTRNIWEDQYERRSAAEMAAQFESDGRAVYRHRRDIVALLELRPGQHVAEIGAGSGFLSRLALVVAHHPESVLAKVGEQVVASTRRPFDVPLTSWIEPRSELDPESSFLDEVAPRARMISANQHGSALVARRVEDDLARRIDGFDGVATGNLGFDASTGQYVDLIDAGIVDPTKVVRLALENAVSVAGVLLLTEATMTEIPDRTADRVAADAERAL